MKRVFLFLFALLLSCDLFAGGIKEIVFFGDSLSDNGNLYNLLKFIPRSPPYYHGRFTNGPTWAEKMGDDYQNKFSIPYHIYAYGGATTVFHNPTDKFFAPMTLDGEMTEYLTSSAFSDKSATLFVFWIGANDYLFEEPSDGQALTTEVIDKINWAMTLLVGEGARQFLILNLPDLAETPYALANGGEILHQLSVMHNEKLAKMLEGFKNLSPDIKIVTIDIYAILNDFLTDIEKFNQKYHGRITVLNKACWEGGLTARQHLAQNRPALQQALQATLATKNLTPGKPLNPRATTDYILASPGLKEAYFVGKLQDDELAPCNDPDAYLFWDFIHPTATVHRMLAAIVTETLNNQVKDLFIG